MDIRGNTVCFRILEAGGGVSRLQKRYRPHDGRFILEDVACG